jgi:DNA primase
MARYNAEEAGEGTFFEDKIGELLKRISLREVLQHLFPGQAFHYRKSIPCPFHQDSSPSGWLMSFKDRGDEYKCFGRCNLPRRGGNVIEILKHVKGCNDDSALQWLVDEKFLEQKDLGSIGNDLKEYAETTNFMEEFFATCNALLLQKITPNTEAVYKWFTETRQIEPGILPDFGVGAYDRDQLEMKYTRPVLEKYGLWAEGAYAHSIIFFYHLSPNTISHRCKLRQINGTSRDCMFIGTTRFQNETGIFGLNRWQHMINAEATKDVYLLEGETGTLQMQSAAWRAFSSANYLNVISRSGVGGLNDSTVRILRDVGIEAIHLFPDNDAGGHDMITSALKLIAPLPISVIWPADYQKGQDPDDYLKGKFSTGGVTVIQATLKGLVTSKYLLAAWLADRQLDEYQANPTDPIVLQKTRNMIVEAAARTALEGMELDDYVHQIQKVLPQFTRESLISEMRKYQAGHRREFKVGPGVRIMRSNDEYMMAVTEKSQDGPILKWRSILNMTITVNKMVLNGDGSEAYKEVTLRHAGKNNPSIIYPSHLEDQNSFISFLDKAYPGKLNHSDDFKKFYRQIINQDNYDAPQVYAFDSFGYRDKNKKDDPYEYLSPSVIISEGKVLPNTKYIAHIPQNQPCELYDFILAREELLIKQVNEAIELIMECLLKIHVPSVTYPLLAFVAGTFIDTLLGKSHGNYILALLGRYQTGKSRTAQAFLNFACNAMPGDGKNCIAVSSTLNASEKAFHHVCDAPGLLDDLKSVHFRISSIATALLQLIQNHFDRKGKSRLTRELGFRQAFPSRCGLILTGEAMPSKEGSFSSRMLNVNVPPGQYNSSLAKQFDENRHLLRIFTPHYIAYTQRLEKFPEPQLILPPNISSDRAFFCAKRIGCGLRLFLDFCVQWPGSPMSQKKADDIWQQFQVVLPSLIEENVIDTQASDDEHKFLSALAQIIQSGEGGYDDSAKGIKIGYLEGQTIVLFPDIVITIVKRYLSNMEFDKTQLYKNLKHLGYIYDSKTVRDPAFINPDKGMVNRGRAWVMDKLKLEELLGRVEAQGGQET